MTGHFLSSSAQQTKKKPKNKKKYSNNDDCQCGALANLWSTATGGKCNVPYQYRRRFFFSFAILQLRTVQQSLVGNKIALCRARGSPRRVSRDSLHDNVHWQKTNKQKLAHPICGIIFFSLECYCLQKFAALCFSRLEQRCSRTRSFDDPTLPTSDAATPPPPDC